MFPEIDRVKNFLLHARPHKSNVYENMYFFVSKKHTHKQKNFHWQSYSYEFSYVFSLQKIKDKALYFSTKKSVVAAVFSVSTIFKKRNWIFCGRPGEDFFRQLHFLKQEYYFFGIIIVLSLESTDIFD